ncbi:MAG: DUF1587 domain-containing protein, partial [Steroidobacteraceae bacterium]
MRNRHIGRFLLAAAACGFTVLALAAEGATQPPGSSDGSSWGSASGAAHPSGWATSAASTPKSGRATAQKTSLTSSAAGGMESAQAKQYWGFLHEYCGKCHNTTDWAGGVAWEIMKPQNIPQDAKVWEKAVQKLGGRLMPPPGNRQPPQATIQAFVHWVEGDIDRAADSHPAYTGWVALHRMNRTEYQQAVWDLVRVKVDGARLLPKDDQAGNFDNIADVLQVSSTFLDQYLSAARTIAYTAVGNRHADAVSVQYVAGPSTVSQLYHEPGLPLGSRGGFQVTKYFPADGEYELDVGNLAVALWLFNLEFKNKLVASIDGRPFWQGNIGGNAQTRAIDQQQDPAVDAINRTLKHIDFNTTAGPHVVTVTFVHRDFAESEGRLQQLTPGDAQSE